MRRPSKAETEMLGRHGTPNCRSMKMLLLATVASNGFAEVALQITV